MCNFNGARNVSFERRLDVFDGSPSLGEMKRYTLMQGVCVGYISNIILSPPIAKRSDRFG